MSYFQSLELQSWRQFDDVKINLGSQTTVLTGANGCGKTSILTVLSHHFGWHINFVSTPFISKKQKKLMYREIGKNQAWKSGYARTEEILPDLDEGTLPDNNPQRVGTITYSNGKSC